ncbi:MAG: histidine--tRNA ligase, partial [Candidatus Acidoferrales bacterium]
ALDAEIIELVMVFIEKCGLKGCSLYVNSIGCSDCRPKYVERLRAELEKVKSKLGPDSQRRIQTNPLRVLDSKVEEEQQDIEKLPSILDHLCPACRDHYEKVKQELKDRGIPFEENWRLVRGLDYYVRTTFEVTAPGLGAQNAVCGGGRYDGLVELLGGPPTKGTGWALGTDRLILALQQAATAKPETPLDVFLVWLGQPAYARARQLARRLRDTGTSVDLTYEETKLKKALGLADRAGARFALILGENELAQNKITLREMQSGHQRSLSEEELLRELSTQATPSGSEG